MRLARSRPNQSYLLSADLSRANLQSTLLVQANLNNAVCEDAMFDDAGAYEARIVSANFRGATLKNVIFGPTDASGADFTRANLSAAGLGSATLRSTKFQLANLSSARLKGSDLSLADLREANLSNANLESAVMVNVCLHGANLRGARVFGASVWNADTESANQEDLVISSDDQPRLTVDNLEIAQFIYLVLNNKKLRDVIDAVTSKLVLILGRFLPERKEFLEAIRMGLRALGYVPVLFDFEPSAMRDLTEMVSTLAHLARFVVADITDAKSIPQELMRIVPNLPSVPVQPLLLASETEYGMFETFKRYPWVLEPFRYRDHHDVVKQFNQRIIKPAETMVRNSLAMSVTRIAQP